MRVLAGLGMAMVMLGALMFVWQVKVPGAGTNPSLALLAAGALLLAVWLLARHRRERSSTGLRHPTL
jgi:Flp pilus assembly protein TadB